jgi:hypothetical protein
MMGIHAANLGSAVLAGSDELTYPANSSCYSEDRAAQLSAAVLPECHTLDTALGFFTYIDLSKQRNVFSSISEKQ